MPNDNAKRQCLLLANPADAAAELQGNPCPTSNISSPDQVQRMQQSLPEGQTIIGGCAAPLLIVYPQTKAQRFKLLRAGFIGSHFHFF